MLAKRIIPCLDIRDGDVVKGINFVGIRKAGDPVELAKRYDEQGADELVLLDITASHERRGTMIDIVRRCAKNIFIPFTVGGGIRSIEDMRSLLRAGADKVSVNTIAVKEPELISAARDAFGSQCVVVAIDAKRTDDSWNVYIKGGREDTGMDAIVWAKKVEELGAGEILLTSMDKDGTKSGYDIELMKELKDKLNIPVIASGGAGSLDDISSALRYYDAALVASLFHYDELTVQDVKDFLRSKGIEVRR